METEYSWQTAKNAAGYQREPVMKRYGWWASLAVLLSILMHLVLYMVFENIHVMQLIPGYEKVIQLPTTRDQTVIDDTTWKRLLEEDVAPPTDLEPPKEDIVYDEAPPELPDITETIKLTPATDVVQNLFTSPAPPPVPTTMTMPALSESLELDMNDSTSAADVKQQLLEASQTKSAAQPTIYVDDVDVATGVDTDELVEQMTKQIGGKAGKAIGAKFSSLDTLLGEGINTPSADVLIPTDLLFGFGDYAVKEEAKLSLMKLGMLILANEKATFIFKGYTDSIPFRPNSNKPGPRNNQQLSLARAEAVRGWLVSQLGLEGFDLRVEGHGSANPLVAPTGNVQRDKELESINRRVEVEIIMRTAPKVVPVKARRISG